MLKYTRIASITGTEGMDVFTPSAMGQAIGDIPGWVLLHDPDYVRDTTVLNRVNGEDNPDVEETPEVISVVTEGGNKFQEWNDGDNPIIDPKSVQLDGTNLTLFAVVKNTTKTSTNLRSIFTGDGSGESSATVRPPSLMFTADANTVLVRSRGGVNTAIGATLASFTPSSSYMSRLAYVMMTYSGGTLRLFDKGVQVAEATGVTPFAGVTVGTWKVLRGFAGLVGLVGAINQDMSAPAMQQYKSKLDSFIIGKYSL